MMNSQPGGLWVLSSAQAFCLAEPLCVALYPGPALSVPSPEPDLCASKSAWMLFLCLSCWMFGSVCRKPAQILLCVCVFYFYWASFCSDLCYFLPYANLRFAVFLVPWGSVLDYLECISFYWCKFAI